MLLELKVTDFAIIENIQISFKKGLNIISGETGAGKSILLKSLSLLMGGKSSLESVRSGSDSATIEGAFDLSQRVDTVELLGRFGISIQEDLFIVRRVISRQGKSRIYLNGHLSTLQHLKDVVSPLIEMAGADTPLIEMTAQHENRQLQNRSYHLSLLDTFSQAGPLRKQVLEAYKKFQNTRSQIEELELQSQQKNQRSDFLTYQQKEIQNLSLAPGDEIQLEDHLKRLKNASRLLDFVSQSESQLYSSENSVTSTLHRIVQKGAELSQADPLLHERIKPLIEAKSLIEESCYDLRNYERELSFSDSELEETEEKLSQLRKLQKKYGKSIQEILNTLKEIELELSQLENSEEQLLDLHKRREELKNKLLSLSNELHDQRSTHALKLTQKIKKELSELNMKGLDFEAHIKKRSELSATGNSEVEFMIRSGKKDSFRPLGKGASGGELSRLLLSLKTVVGTSNKPRTFLFDEVDTGVSGTTAEKVGRKLKKISQGQQVICITHLPQVAAFADHHYFIEKQPTKGSTQMSVLELSRKEKVEEIARLISGEKITPTSRKHAQELIKESQTSSQPTNSIPENSRRQEPLDRSTRTLD